MATAPRPATAPVLEAMPFGTVLLTGALLVVGGGLGYSVGVAVLEFSAASPSVPVSSRQVAALVAGLAGGLLLAIVGIALEVLS